MPQGAVQGQGDVEPPGFAGGQVEGGNLMGSGDQDLPLQTALPGIERSRVQVQAAEVVSLGEDGRQNVPTGQRLREFDPQSPDLGLYPRASRKSAAGRMTG